MANKAVALALSTHPGPTIAVTTITVVLGAAVGLSPGRLAFLGLAMLLGQASVGLSNDWLDADRDRRAGRRDKPVAAGWVSARSARDAAMATAGLAIVLTLPLGLPATAAHAVFMVSAWSYNLWLKRTALSVLPYVISFGLLPALVALARPVPASAAPWALALGALLGVAAHFANVLPDLDDDARTGVRGLPHRLGRRASGTAACLALAAAAVLALIGPGGHRPWLWAGFAVTLAAAAAGAVAAASRSPGRLLFALVIVAALMDVAMLVVSGEQILARP